MNRVLAFFFATAMISCLVGCHSNNPQTEERTEPPSVTNMTQSNEKTDQSPIAVLDLYAEFEKDQEAARNVYKGKRITVTGTVVKTGPDPHQKPGIELAATKDGETVVLCVVDSFDQLDGIDAGDVITASGNFYEFWRDKWVVLKQSEVQAR